MDSNDENFKVVILGEYKVGKTSIINRKLYGSMGITTGTIGFDHKRIVIKFSDKNVILDIFDTAGQERFSGTISVIERNCNIFILMYSINNDDKDDPNYGFDKIDQLYNQAKEVTDVKHVFVVQNKTDLINNDDLYMAGTKGRDWCETHNAFFYQTSALTGENIDNLFQDIAEKALSLKNPNIPNKVVLGDNNEPKNNCSC